MKEYYGVLTTYNPYTKKWYAFDNGSVSDFFSHPHKVVYAEGKKPINAIKNYLKIKNESN
jgi:hypothetical protein